MPIDSLQISGSALTAERTHMDAIAENLSNAQTTRGPDGKAYRRQVVLFETVLDASGGAGVKVSRVVPSSEPLPKVYNPGHPDADANGYVEMPNVNVAEEMVDMVSASRAYDANVGAAEATKGMIARALDLAK